MNWEPIVTVCLPYAISANRYWSRRYVKPSKGKPGFVQDYVTPEARAYKEEVGWRLRKAGVRQPMTGRVRVDIQLHPNCPQDWRTRVRKDPLWWADSVQRLDIDNVNKVLLDALKGVAIVDDAQVWEITGRVMEPKPDVQACVTVRISRGIQVSPQAALELPEQPREVAFP